MLMSSGIHHTMKLRPTLEVVIISFLDYNRVRIVVKLTWFAT
jgi:hypothetical protein